MTVQIPSDASTSRSDCSSSSYSVFDLTFNTITTGYEIGMNFTTSGGSFKLHTLSAGMISTSSKLVWRIFIIGLIPFDRKNLATNTKKTKSTMHITYMSEKKKIVCEVRLIFTIRK